MDPSGWALKNEKEQIRLIVREIRLGWIELGVTNVVEKTKKGERERERID